MPDSHNSIRVLPTVWGTAFVKSHVWWQFMQQGNMLLHHKFVISIPAYIVAVALSWGFARGIPATTHPTNFPVGGAVVVTLPVLAIGLGVAIALGLSFSKLLSEKSRDCSIHLAYRLRHCWLLQLYWWHPYVCSSCKPSTTETLWPTRLHRFCLHHWYSSSCCWYCLLWWNVWLPCEGMCWWKEIQ